MSNSPGKYGNVREFLDNLGNEKIKICKNCNAVFSYQNETTVLCISCDFEEEVSTLPAVVEIEDEFEMAEAEPAVLAVQPTILQAEPVVAEVDIVESTNDWDMDSFDDFETETVVEEPLPIDAVEIEPVVETVEDETVAEVAVEAETIAEVAVEDEPVTEVAVEAETVAEVAVEAETVAEVAIEAETIKDAIKSDEIATAIVEDAIEKEEEAIVKVEEATDDGIEAVEEYSEAVKVEDEAAEIVTEAAIVQNDAVEAVVEASEKVSELVESGAAEKEVKEALSDLEETVQSKDEAEVKLSEAVEEEEQAAVKLEEKVEEKDGAEEKLESEIEELKEAGNTLDIAIAQKDQSEKELAQTADIDTDNDVDDDSEPFANGDYVSHGVYGNGEVLGMIRAGKHWSIEVNFDEGKRRILGTFLAKVDKPKINQVESDYEPPVEKVKEANIKTYDEHTGKYKPGIEVLHDIFGKGFIRESEPKGENFKLIVNFEDGSERTLLSTFIKLPNEGRENESVTEAVEAEPIVEAVEDEPVAEAVEAEPIVEAVEDEPVVEAVEAEPVVEAVEAETVVEAVESETVLEAVEVKPVVSNNDAFKRPSKKVEEVIDLSKPEIQDAEMIDDED